MCPKAQCAVPLGLAGELHRSGDRLRKWGQTKRTPLVLIHGFGASVYHWRSALRGSGPCIPHAQIASCLPSSEEHLEHLGCYSWLKGEPEMEVNQHLLFLRLRGKESAQCFSSRGLQLRSTASSGSHREPYKGCLLFNPLQVQHP